MESPVGFNGDTNRHSEETFKNILSPIEPFVMHVQSLLVWESPRKSAFLFIIVHVIFWFLAVFGCQIYFFISTALIITHFVRTWKRRIWPEIRVPPKEPEDPDSWTPVHPRLLSVPEICKYLAQIWCSLSKTVNSCLSFRRNHRFLFCVVSCFVFISLAILGHYIPGLLLSYVAVISIMLWPCVLYHNLLQRVYLKFEPVFMKLDYSLKLKSKWSFKGKKSRNKDSGINSFEDDNGNTDTDSDDFCPSLDPAATAALARAITDSEDESNGTPSLNTPMLSKEHSFSDDHEEEDFTPDLGNLPSIGHLDDTDDEILEPQIPRTKQEDLRTIGQDSMRFHPSHFGDSSDSEDDTLTKDLKFPDIHEVQSPEPSQEVAKQQDAGMAMLASAIVSNTFSSMMQSAMSGLMAAKSSSKGNNPEKVTYQKDESDIDIQPVDRKQDKWLAPQSSFDSDDIADEFEFLDQYDVDDDKETK